MPCCCCNCYVLHFLWLSRWQTALNVNGRERERNPTGSFCAASCINSIFFPISFSYWGADDLYRAEIVYNDPIKSKLCLAFSCFCLHFAGVTWILPHLCSIKFYSFQKRSCQDERKGEETAHFFMGPLYMNVSFSHAELSFNFKCCSSIRKKCKKMQCLEWEWEWEEMLLNA